MERVPSLIGKHYNALYLTPETFCDDDRIQSAAGGLGVVADSYLYELEHNFEKHNFTALQIGLYCSHGYQKQVINNGFMEVVYEKDPHPELTVDTGITIPLVLAGVPCMVAVMMPVEDRKHTTRLLLNTDIPENSLNYRMITRTLYAEGHATKFFSEDNKPWDNIDWLRILQAAVLGIGSYYLIKALRISYDVLHLNESHPVFFLVHDLGIKRQDGTLFGKALEELQRNSFFTNHTLLESGNKRYRTHEVSRILRDYAGFDEDTLRMLGQKSDYTFSMTDAALFLVGPGHTNGVSKLHADIANRLWPGYDIIPITNGVSNRYQHPEFKRLTDPNQIPKLKTHFKEVLYANLTQRLKDAGLQKEIVTPASEAVLVTWARRHQDYKRSGLMWHDAEFEFVKKLLEWNWVAIAWGGYVHPDDAMMMNRWNEYWQKFRDLPNTIAVFNYRLDLMRPLLKAGSQIWLNTPWFGREACGTSGMGSALNCTKNVSIKDGWMQENSFDTFGSQEEGDWHTQYAHDACELWKAVTTSTVLLRNNDPCMLATLFENKLEVEEKFSSERMVNDYIKKLYQV
jgi:starch phosphorylase